MSSATLCGLPESTAAIDDGVPGGFQFCIEGGVLLLGLFIQAVKLFILLLEVFVHGTAILQIVGDGPVDLL